MSLFKSLVITRLCVGDAELAFARGTLALFVPHGSPGIKTLRHCWTVALQPYYVTSQLW